MKHNTVIRSLSTSCFNNHSHESYIIKLNSKCYHLNSLEYLDSQKHIKFKELIFFNKKMRGVFKEVHDTELDESKDEDKDKIEKEIHIPLLKTRTGQNVNPGNNDLPVDTGLSLVIPFGVTFEIVIIVGLFKSTGIIFVAIQASDPMHR